MTPLETELFVLSEKNTKSLFNALAILGETHLPKRRRNTAGLHSDLDYLLDQANTAACLHLGVTKLLEQSVFSMIYETPKFQPGDLARFISDFNKDNTHKLVLISEILKRLAEFNHPNLDSFCSEINRACLKWAPRICLAGNLEFEATDFVAIEKEIIHPLMLSIEAPVWKNVRDELTGAMERRAGGDYPGASKEALRAVESAMKVAIAVKDPSVDTSKMAAGKLLEYLSQKSRLYIEGWEREIVQSMFSKFRNSTNHGAGTGTPLSVNDANCEFILLTSIMFIRRLSQID